MPFDPSSPVRRRAGFLAACLAVGLSAGAGNLCAEDVLKPLRVLGESGFHHAASLSEIVVLSDGKRFLSSSRDGSARLWELESGRELRRFIRGASGDIWGLLVLPGEKELLTAGGDGFVTRWELETGKELMTYEHETTVFRLALRPGGKEFVATDNKNVAVLWNLETGKRLKTFKGHTDSVYTAIFTPDGNRLLTGASDGKLKVWDVESGKCTRTHEEDFEDVYTLRASPDGKRFVMCSADDVMRVFDMDSLKIAWKNEFENDIKVADWSPDGGRVATACEDGFLYVFDAKKGKRLEKIEVQYGYHTPVAFTSDGKGLISGGDLMLYHHEIKSGDRIMPKAGDPKVREGVDAVALSADGGRVYAVGDDDVIQVWETGSGKLVNSIEVEHSVKSMAVSRNSEFLATGESDGAVRLRSAETGALKREFRSEGTIEQVLFARNDEWLLAAGTDDKVHLWDVATGNEVRSFVGHSNDVNAIAVSQDGLTLVTASDDKTARLWDIETGEVLREFHGIEDNLYGAACLGDGRSFLISAREPELWGWLAPAVVIAEELPREEIDRLVTELASETFSERAAATEALIARGARVLPLLETLRPEDPEAAYRLRRVRSKIRTAQYEGDLDTLTKFNKDMSALKTDPTGRFWVASVGSEADSRIVIGNVRDRKLHILQEISDGHSPRHLSFSADGKTLVTGNRDGTVSMFRVRKEE